MVKIITANNSSISWREEPVPSDIKDIIGIVRSTGFFNMEELSVAAELVEERLKRGIESGYYFLFLEEKKVLTGYSCYGPVPGTRGSFDLYWIAVNNDARGAGLGRMIIERTERKIKDMGGTGIYIETASKDLYLPTRKFYEICGYFPEARLMDFYAPGDDKIIYVKKTLQGHCA